MTVIDLTTIKRDAARFGQQEIDELAAGLDGFVVRPEDSGFDEAATIWNGAVRRQPGLIARCASAEDVARAVRFAAENSLLVAVRGGGHGVAGHATCDGGLMIDLSPMNGVEVDADARIARAGGGATWADLDTATQAHGLAAPGGLVSTTGIAGLTLGGGLGWLRCKHGLSCDSLAAVEIVTADGAILTASETENAELFWGLHGGGGNFGVVTRFDYRLHPLGPEVMFAFVFYPLEDGRKVLKGWRDFCAGAPDEISSLTICGTIPDEEPFPENVHGRQFVMVAALYAGAVSAGERALQPLRELGEALCDFSEPMPYADIQAAFDADYPTGRRYYWKSLYLDRLDNEGIEAVLELAAARPSALSTVDVWQLGGAIARVPADATAFADRDAPFLLGIESNWDDPAEDERNRTWTRKACDRMQRYSTGRSYLNFEPEIAKAGHPQDERQRRLARLKRSVDPDNLFRMNHNIAPA